MSEDGLIHAGSLGLLGRVGLTSGVVQGLGFEQASEFVSNSSTCVGNTRLAVGSCRSLSYTL